MALRPPIGVNGIDIDGSDERLRMGALVSPAGLLRARSGALGGPVVVTAQPTPNMTVSVPSFAVVVDGAGFGTGAVVLTNVGAATVTIGASSVTNPRIDLLVARWTDSTSTPDDLLVVAGTPGVVPVRPAQPPNTLLLADIRVAQSASSITSAAITNSLLQTGLLGGIVPSRNALDVAPVYDGQARWRLDTKQLELVDGGAFRLAAPQVSQTAGNAGVLPPAPQTTPMAPIVGNVVQTIVNGQGETQVTFPTAFPGGVLAVVATVQYDVPGQVTGAFSIRTQHLIQTGFVAQIRDSGGALIGQGIGVRVCYIAYGW